MCVVGGVGDWVGVSDWGWGGSQFYYGYSSKNEPKESCEKVSKPPNLTQNPHW